MSEIQQYLPPSRLEQVPALTLWHELGDADVIAHRVSAEFRERRGFDLVRSKPGSFTTRGDKQSRRLECKQSRSTGISYD